MFVMRQASSLRDWARIYCLYRQAFPSGERKPFQMIVSMYRRGKTDVWLVEQDGRFAGFAATINGGDLVLLDYLAVSRHLRGRGIGSRAMRELIGNYPGKGMFVEIESVHETGAANLPERTRRLRFYLDNGMEDLHVRADVFGVYMQLLGRQCSMDFEHYRAFYRDHYSPWAAEHITEHKD